MDQSNYEAVCFEIISCAGTAKSCFLEAIQAAKSGEDYATLIKEGTDAFEQASKAHFKALQMETNNELPTGLLLIHAETILCSAETIRDLSSTIIELINKQQTRGLGLTQSFYQANQTSQGKAKLSRG